MRASFAWCIAAWFRHLSPWLQTTMHAHTWYICKQPHTTASLSSPFRSYVDRLASGLVFAAICKGNEDNQHCIVHSDNGMTMKPLSFAPIWAPALRLVWCFEAHVLSFCLHDGQSLYMCVGRHYPDDYSLRYFSCRSCWWEQLIIRYPLWGIRRHSISKSSLVFFVDFIDMCMHAILKIFALLSCAWRKYVSRKL